MADLDGITLELEAGQNSPPGLDRRHSLDMMLPPDTPVSKHFAAVRSPRRIHVIVWITSLLVIILATVPFCYMAIEKAKEVHVKDGVILDAQDNPVATAQYISYATLFDLPSFSIETLAAVKQVNLQLSESMEALFSVTSVIKHTHCHAITFYSPDGAEIIVDGKTATVLAKVHGRTYVLTSTPRSRMLSSSGSGRPRLYTQSEFKERGFFGSLANVSTSPLRRLITESDNGGWASLGISVAAAALEDCNIGALQHESVSISGTLFTGQERVQVNAFVNRSEEQQSAVLATYSDGRSVLIDYAVGIEFNYDSAGDLTECEPMSDASPPNDELRFLESTSVDTGAVLITGEDVEGLKFLLQVDDFLLDVKSEPLQRPSVADCVALPKQRRSQNHRRLAGGACSAETYALASAAYDDGAGADQGSIEGWTEVKKCENANALAKIWTKDGQVAVGFAGSDFGDRLGDWRNNLHLFSHEGFHGGFYHYVEKVKTCLDQAVHEHGGQVHFYVGHSLGGAAATVYFDIASNAAPNASVITYGAPKTHVASGCTIPGTRFAHVSDPVPSNFWGAMGDYHHKIQEVKFYQDKQAHRRRRRWSWRRRRNWGWDSDLADGCAQESKAGKVLDTAYHFAITHTSYESHGEQSCR